MQHLELPQHAEHSWSRILWVDAKRFIVFLHQQDPVTVCSARHYKGELT
jgi:hypothetical protein